MPRLTEAELETIYQYLKRLKFRLLMAPDLPEQLAKHFFKLASRKSFDRDVGILVRAERFFRKHVRSTEKK